MNPNSQSENNPFGSQPSQQPSSPTPLPPTSVPPVSSQSLGTSFTSVPTNSSRPSGFSAPLQQSIGFTVGSNSPAPFPQQPTPAATGDIIIGSAPTNPSKKKRTAILFLIILAVISIAFVAFYLARQFTPLSSKETPTFNIYANHILYGEATTSPLEGEYNEYHNYTAYNKYYQSDQTDTAIFFETANQYFQSFLESAKTLDANSELATTLTDYQNNFDLIYRNTTSTALTDDQINQAFHKSGQEATKILIKQTYAPYLESTSGVSQQYGQNMVTFFETYVDILSVASQAGCITASSIDQTCFNNSVSSESLSQLDSLGAERSSLSESALDYVIRGCWDINQFLGDNV